MMRNSFSAFEKTTLCASLVLALGSGCSSSSGDGASGGQASGGASLGGATSSGGKGSGGLTSTGGSASGGASTGGSGTSGGSANGGAAAGGAATNGGSTSGGASAGGKASAGGSSTGGSSAGGSSAGGNSAGGSSAGGKANTGGSSASGGSSAMGGAAGASSGGQTSGTCPTPALASGDSNKKITVGGLEREYILHVPSTYKGTSPAPLVIDFHPIGGSATQWRSGSPYPAVLDKDGVVTVYPNGKPSPNVGNAWNVGGCCVSKVNGADVDDVAFAKALVAEVQKVACIDPKRVYAVGFSMGGGMSNYLACHAADVFAAVGPAAFDLTEQNVTGCKPARPITVIEWRGKNDSTVKYEGGHSAVVTNMAIDFLGAVGTFKKWAELDSCTGSASAADSNGCQTYSQCSAGVQVTLCTQNNGGHDAAKADVVWPMLKKYTLP